MPEPLVWSVVPPDWPVLAMPDEALPPVEPMPLVVWPPAVWAKAVPPNAVPPRARAPITPAIAVAFIGSLLVSDPCATLFRRAPFPSTCLFGPWPGACARPPDRPKSGKINWGGLSMTPEEPPLDPQRPIIDPHLHLWHIQPAPGSLQEPQRFLLEETLQTIGESGHNVTHTVFVECHAMHRQDGPPELRPVGETEFVNGVAAMSASGGYGPCRVAHRIVGHADLLLGEAVAPVLEAHVARGGERFRGVRFATAWSEAGMFGYACDPAGRGLMLDARLRDGARTLARMGLSLDLWCFHTQLDELADLAAAVPELTIVLDHIGTPERLGAYEGREAEARAEWAAQMAELARRPNVRVKIGGLGMDLTRPIPSQTGPASSGALAARWRPYVETCIEAFTPARCMFESNFPPDRAGGSYGATWNAFKLIARGCSEAEQDRLFRGTAAETYRI
jgi:predicted TIM-barrel fold metal-dependent hydrolase